MSTTSDLEATRAREEPLILERHGIDYIPPSERHGKPYTLFTFWAASNIQILAISVGVLAVTFGLSLGWAIFAIIVGNAFGGLYMALHSVQGPRLGLPQMMQSRAQFGMYGTALPNTIVILMYLGYFVSSAVLGGLAVANLLHVTTAEGIMIINAFVLLIVWFGYDLFHAYCKVVTWLSLGAFLAIFIKLLTVMPSHLPAGHNSACTTCWRGTGWGPRPGPAGSLRSWFPARRAGRRTRRAPARKSGAGQRSRTGDTTCLSKVRVIRRPPTHLPFPLPFAVRGPAPCWP